MKNIVTTLAIVASASMAQAVFVLVPNGDFAVAAGDSWNQAGSGGTVITYESTGGNTGGYGKIDNTAGAWGGVLVAEGGAGANPAGGGGIPLADMGLVAGNTYSFSLDMISFGDAGASGGIKLESWSDTGILTNSGDQNSSVATTWDTYTTSYTIDAAATRIKVVPLTSGGGAVSIGFDNIGVENNLSVPEPSSTLLAALSALGFIGFRRRK